MILRMNVANTSVAILLIIAGLLIGIGYTFILIISSPTNVVEILRITVSILSLAIGAFLGAVGIIMLRGIKVEDEDENTG